MKKKGLLPKRNSIESLYLLNLKIRDTA